MPFALDFSKIHNPFIKPLQNNAEIPRGVCYNEYNERRKAEERKEKRNMEKYFRVTKVDISTGKEYDYGGGYTEKDVKDITAGYKLNKTFGYYERKNGKFLFFVDEDEKIYSANERG